jgi:hypothetical protein
LKIILVSPVRQDFETLNLALGSHVALRGLAERWYYDDNDSADSADLLARGGGRILPSTESEKPDYDTTGETHAWNPKLVSRIARIRNLAIEEFLKTDADALFIVDSDLILHPSLVEHLASLDQPIVSEVFWSKWRPQDSWMPNVWDGHPYAFTSPESITRLRDKTTRRVGGLGACTLIRREALQPGVRYIPVSGLEHIWGEDRWFCERASAHDIPLAADTHFPPFHVYRKEQLEEARTWFECGCPPDYFRDTWLTDEWATQIEKSMAKRENKKFACVLPGEHFSQAWVGAWTEIVSNLSAHFDVSAQFGFASNIYFIRQGMFDAVRTIEPQPEYILWVDDDQILTTEALQHLVRDLEENPGIDIVCGWAWCENNIYGGMPMLSCGVFDHDGKIKRLEYDEMQAIGQDLIPISYSGFPAVLMRGRILDLIAPKAFMPIMDPEAFPPFGMSGEDVAFFIRAREAGLQCVVDRRVKVPHLKLRCAEPVQTASLEAIPKNDGAPVS